MIIIIFIRIFGTNKGLNIRSNHKNKN